MSLPVVNVNAPMGTAVRCPTCSKMYDVKLYPTNCERCNGPMDEAKALKWAEAKPVRGMAMQGMG